MMKDEHRTAVLRVLVVALLAALHCSPQPAHAADLLIRNARLIDGTGAPPRAGIAILVRDGRIVAIGPELSADDVLVLDVAGATVLPGLVDAHVHLGVIPGTEYRDDPVDVADNLRRVHLRGYLAAGVTTVLDTAASVKTVRNVRAWLAAGNPGPTYLTLGPPLATPGGYMAVDNPDTTVSTPEQLDAAFDIIQSLGALGVKVPIEKGFGPEPVWPIHSPEMRRAIARKAADRGLPIYVHASSEDEQAIGLEMGAYALVHTDFYAGPPSREFVDQVVQRRAYMITTFSIMDAELTRWHPERLDDALVARVVPQIERRTARDPEAGWYEAETEIGFAIPWLPQRLRRAAAWWFITEDRFRSGLANGMRAAKTLHDAGVPQVIGSDAGNWEIIPYQFHATSTHREIELLGEAGVAPAEVLAAATTTPARMLRLDNEIGTIEAGKRADLVVVDGDPLTDLRALRAIRWTIKNGVARTPAEWMETE